MEQIEILVVGASSRKKGEERMSIHNVEASITKQGADRHSSTRHFDHKARSR